MKKIIKSFAVAVAMVLSASVLAEDAAPTSYMYWMTEYLYTPVAGQAWEYAKVKYSGGSDSGFLGVADGGDTFGKNLLIGQDFYAMQVAIGSVTLGESYKFALELFNSNGDAIGISQWIDYDPGYIGSKSMSAKEAKFSGFQVPEPTSGLLAMLGFGLLALRRKQKKA